MILCKLLVIVAAITLQQSYAQTILKADGSEDSYALINSVLATNGGDVVESPGPSTSTNNCDNHSSFGQHITQVFDNEVGEYVFAFHIHLDEDSDRCKNFDRQRNEIKTYDKSPDKCKGIVGEVVEYK